MSIDTAAQIVIIACGAASVWLTAQRAVRVRRWGYIVGLCAQPAWFWTTIYHEQYLIAALAVWYTYSWGQGIWNFWIRPSPLPPEPA